MSETKLGLGDRLALDRALQNSFGFTVFKFLQVLQESSAAPVLRPQAPRNLGLTLIAIGTSVLVVASVQYRKQMSQLGADRTRSPLDLTFIFACLLALLGLLLFGSILLRSGPFG